MRRRESRKWSETSSVEDSMAAKDVGFAVIGLGMGRQRSRMIDKTDGAKLAVVCDLNEERAKEMSDELGVPYTLDHHEAIERDDVDVVLVMTPTGAHLPVVIDAAGAGKTVVTTKPLEVTAKRCDQAIEACEKAGVVLAVDFQARYTEGMRTVKHAIDQGILGKLVFGEATLKWFRSQQYYDRGGWRGTWEMDGGGSLMNQSIHPIDLLLWFMGDAARVVGYAGILTHEIETEDLGMALIEFANGAVGRILGTTTYPDSRRFEVNVHGDVIGVTTRNEQLDEWHVRQDAEMPELNVPAGPSNVVEDMVSVVREGKKPLVDGREGRRAVELIHAIYQSAREGQWVTLPR
jgi:predicted dehydrogenase